ncbi:hypothetical protein [Lysobacter sp. CA199]|uniref:hypothetical protein n=1 Tax=Lysobacter sp. CA199 TaxID=3455608 RepID=UPI003F8D511C
MHTNQFWLQAAKGTFMHRYILAIALAVSAPCGASASDAADKEAILSVAARFKNSIIEKDRRAFLDLFLHNRVTWQSVTSDERHKLDKLEKPAAERAAYRPEKNPESFIDDIVDSPAKIEETFENIVLDTDGSAASVAFNFKFRRNDKVINVGREYWLLVKTDGGWKIASVVWSNNTPPAPN